MQEVKAKPPLYSYVSNWQFPRSSWPNLGKRTSSSSTISTILDKALDDGTIIGYGVDKNLVLQPDAVTHDTWWSSMSLAGLVRVQEKIAASDGNNSPVLASATKHWDSIYVSRYYNWNVRLLLRRLHPRVGLQVQGKRARGRRSTRSPRT